MAFAFSGFEAELEEELRRKSANSSLTFERLDERLFLLRTSSRDLSEAFVWTQCLALDGKRVSVMSISEAARILKTHPLPRGSYSIAHHRRCELIRSQAKDAPLRRIDFLPSSESTPWQFWTLLKPDELWTSTNCWPRAVMGLREFVEDKNEPPSRAYLKLWEMFSLGIVPPRSGQRVLDLGAAPGGWTWVLSQMGCDVTAFDKGRLELAASPRIHFREQDVFQLSPADWPVDWLFCDMITEPKKLQALLHRWLAVWPHLRCVCSVKFKGATDFAMIEQFLKDFPGSRVQHLYHNKHELTWVHNVSLRANGLLDKLPLQN